MSVGNEEFCHFVAGNDGVITEKKGGEEKTKNIRPPKTIFQKLCYSS